MVPGTNNLFLNTTKIKEIIFDFRRHCGNINGMSVERVYNFTFLGTTITADLTWSKNTKTILWMCAKLDPCISAYLQTVSIS